MSKMTSGWPEERGLYRCQIDGNEQVLVHHFCGDTGRHWWTDTAGHDIIRKVLFDPDPVAIRKRKQ